MDKITENWKILFADKKRFIVELVKVGLGLLFMINLAIPFFRLTGGTLAQSYALDDYGGLWGLVALFFLAWLAYPLLLLMGMNKIAWFVYIGQAGVGALMFLILLLTFFNVNAQIAVHLSFGFFMYLIYVALMFVIAFLEKPLLAMIEKSVGKK